MLTNEDLQAIGSILRTEIGASETRMTAKIEESEERTKTHMNTVIESQLMPAIRQIADGVLQVNDRLDRMEKRLDSLEETVTAHELYFVRKAAAQG